MSAEIGPMEYRMTFRRGELTWARWIELRRVAWAHFVTPRWKRLDWRYGGVRLFGTDECCKETLQALPWLNAIWERESTKGTK